MGESVYNESEAEEEFVPSNEPLRPSAVVLSARPSSIWDFENTGGTGSSTDRVATVESESESFDDGHPLEPLPPPPAEYLVDWEFLKRAGVTLADPAKGEIIWDPITGDPENPPFQGKILCDQRSVFSIDFTTFVIFIAQVGVQQLAIGIPWDHKQQKQFGNCQYISIRSSAPTAILSFVLTGSLKLA